MQASVYPGNSIQIPFATLGERQGIAPGVLRVEEMVENKRIRMLLNPTLPHCSHLPYNIIQNDNNVNSTTLFLSVHNSRVAVIPSSRVSVHVSILACLVGFELSQNAMDTVTAILISEVSLTTSLATSLP